MVRIKRDLNPSPTKVAIIGVLVFIESLLGGVIVVLEKGEMPNEIQLITILCVAALALVTYLLAFYRAEW